MNVSMPTATALAALVLLVSACDGAGTNGDDGAATTTGSAGETTSGESDAPADAVSGLIELDDPLDEPELYCIDVAGFGESIDLESALRAHTCTGNEDQVFTVNAPGEGQISLDAFDRCIEAEDPTEGAQLLVESCSDTSLQRFTYTDAHEIRLSEASDLCLAVADEPGEPTGGPSHVVRDLALESCDQTDASLARWTPGSEI